MLVKFSVENFLSIKQRIEFSMLAGKSSAHPAHVIKKCERTFLKGSFIYGANAAGKSNFIRAIDFARKVVLKNLNSVRTDKMYFRLDNKCKNSPGIFQFDLYSNGNFYSYGFAISYSDTRILEEWLYQINDHGEICVFERGINEDGNESCVSKWIFNDEKAEQKFNVYREAIKNKEMDQIFFLEDVATHTSQDDGEYYPFHDVMKWFKRIIVIFPNSHFGRILDFVQNPSGKKLSNLLNYFDTGIEGITTIKKNIDDSVDDVPPHLIEEIRNEILKVAPKSRENGKFVVLLRGKELIQISCKQGEFFMDKIGTDHGDKENLFEYQDESDGTRRLFDLLPVYQLLEKNPIIFVDELDRSLHTMATIKFIEKFYESSEKTDSQLIVTLHDDKVLNLSLIRSDEIWFIERDTDHSSRMYPLAKFKIKLDSDVGREYLMGRYGAIPIFENDKIED